MSAFKQFTLKVANMRTEQSFTIYPYKGGDQVQLQSDKRFIVLDIRTGRGVINSKNENYANYIKLQMSPIKFDLPEDKLTEIKAYLWNNSGIKTNGVLSIVNAELD